MCLWRRMSLENNVIAIGLFRVAFSVLDCLSNLNLIYIPIKLLPAGCLGYIKIIRFLKWHKYFKKLAILKKYDLHRNNQQGMF